MLRSTAIGTRVAAIALTAFARLAFAQTTNAACVPIATADTISMVVMLDVKPADEKSKVPAGYLDLIAAGMQTYFPRSKGVTSDVFAETDTSANRTARVAFAATYSATVRPDGRITDEAVLTTTGRMVDDAILLALRTLDTTSDVPPPAFSGADGVRLVLTLYAIDELELRRGVRYPAGVPLIKLRTPTYAFDYNPYQVPGTGKLRYPEEMRSRGIEGDVVAQFVINTTGRVETQSIRFVETTSDDFARAVYDAIPSMRFGPLQIGECMVRTLVKTAFLVQDRTLMSFNARSLLQCARWLSVLLQSFCIALPPFRGVLAQSPPSCILPAPRDSEQVTVFVGIRAAQPDATVPPSYRELLALGFKQYFRLHDGIVSDVYADAKGPKTGENLAVPVIGGTYGFGVTAEGRIAGVSTISGTYTPSVESAVRNAFAALDTSDAVPPPTFLNGKAIHLVVTLQAAPNRMARKPPQFDSLEVPLFTYVAPLYPQSVPAIIPGTMKSPHVDDGRFDQKQRELDLEMVVDAAGVPEMQSVRILSMTSVDMAKAVLDVLPTARFKPLKLGDCAVRMIVRQQHQISNVSR